MSRRGPRSKNPTGNVGYVPKYKRGQIPPHLSSHNPRKNSIPINEVAIQIPPPPPVEVAVRTERQGCRAWPHCDFFVIVCLWSVECIQKVASAWKTVTLSAQFTETRFQDKTVNVFGLVHSAFMMLAFCASSIALSTLADNWEFKFWILIGGMVVYATSFLYAYLYVKGHAYICVLLMYWLDIGWFVTNPLRFYLIFHQRFPIKAQHTRLTTTFMIFLVEVTVYLSMVYITYNVDFTIDSHINAWISLLGAIAIWIIAVFLMEYWLLETPSDIEKISELYRVPDASLSFKHRQQPNISFHFVMLLIPSPIFSILIHATTLTIEPYLDWWYFSHRIDMVIGLCLIPIASWIISNYKSIQEEIKDLYVIGIAFCINVLAFVMVIIALPHLKFVNNEESSRGMKEALLTSVNIVVPDTWQKRFHLVFNGKENTHHGWSGLGYHIVSNSKNRNEGVIQGFLDEKELFKTDIVLTPGQEKWYYLKSKTAGLAHLTNFATPNFEEGVIKYQLLNLAESCSVANEPLKCWSADDCLSIAIEISPLINGDEVANVREIPQSGSGGPVHEVRTKPRTTVKFIVKMYLDGTLYKLESFAQDDALLIILITPSPDTGKLQLTSNLYEVPRLHLAPNKKIIFTTSNIMNSSLQSPKTNISFNTNHFNVLNFHDREENKDPTTTALPSPTEPPVLFNFSLLIMPLSAMTSASYSIAKISYIHFIWIMCPFLHRPAILAVFFSWSYLIRWLAQLDIPKVTIPIMIFLIIIQVVLIVYHIFFTVTFARLIPKLSISDETQSRKF